ncbi:MAG: response regulator transcription factor [Bacteroidetes bacterium]|nr:response regulator transcription factor [Bacteroidota bacterium]
MSSTNTEISNRASADANRLNVWVVEDNDLLRATLEDLLTNQDSVASVTLFNAGEPAIKSLEDGELPDVVLMDIGLPGMSGIETVTELRSRAPALPVVMLTVYRDNDRIFKAICAGASGYLLKTSPPERIVEALGVAVSGGSPIDEYIARRILDIFARMNPPTVDYNLTERESQILQHLVDGSTQKQIAEKLHVSAHTIDGHVRHIYAKLEVHTRSGAVAKALREGLV